MSDRPDLLEKIQAINEKYIKEIELLELAIENLEGDLSDDSIELAVTLWSRRDTYAKVASDLSNLIVTEVLNEL